MNPNIQEQDISLNNKIIDNKSTSDESEDEENMHFFGQTSKNFVLFRNSSKNENDSTFSSDFEKEKNRKNKNSRDVELMKMLLVNESSEESKSKDENQKNIFLNQVMIKEIKLNNFPIIEEININDYMIPVDEKILDKKLSKKK